MERPDFFELKNGSKVKLPFSKEEYKQRIKKLRNVMEQNNLRTGLATMCIGTGQGISTILERSY